MHFLEAGLDKQASTLLRIVAVALRVADIEEEEVNASEQSEEAGSARHLDAASAELITEAKVEGRLEEEPKSERQDVEVGSSMQASRDATMVEEPSSAETTEGRDVRPENAPESKVSPMGSFVVNSTCTGGG